MPELPEVETIARALADRLPGRRILSVESRSALVAKNPLTNAVGRRITSVRRHGKFLVLECDGGRLVIHLGMTGKLLTAGVAGPYTRVIVELEDGPLLYDDIRQFGRVDWYERLPDRLTALGPDPLVVTADDFLAALRQRKTRIKPLLLNQRFLRGLGNIYADEALFRARIHPRAIASRLSAARALALHQAIVETLTLAVERRGSSISDYVDADGQRGSFQLFHQVYQKQGRPCPRCAAVIRRIVVAQRGTHYCPRCQRA